MFAKQSLTVMLSSLIALSTLAACAAPTPQPVIIRKEVTRLVVVTPTPRSTEPEGVIQSDSGGKFQIKDPEGALITVTLQDAKGNGIAGARIMNASYSAGTLLYIAPPVESPLVPKFHFINRAQGRIGGLLSPLPQGMSSITVHLSDVDTAPLIQETPVPGPLDEFWKSAGWKRAVDTTRSLCETYSTLSDLSDMKDTAVLSYDVTRGIIQSMSFKKLLKVAWKDIASLSEGMIKEGFVQLCLAATGDEVGLRGLTGVVHERDRTRFLVVETPLPGIVSGRVLDDQTRRGLRDVVVATALGSTQTIFDGRFYLPPKTADQFDLTLKRDGYSPRTVSVNPLSSGYLDLGDLVISATPSQKETELPLPVPPPSSQDEPVFPDDLSHLALTLADIDGVPHCGKEQAMYRIEGAGVVDPAKWEQAGWAPAPNATGILMSTLSEYYLGTAENDGGFVFEFVFRFSDVSAARHWMEMWRSNEISPPAMSGQQVSRQLLPAPALGNESLAYGSSGQTDSYDLLTRRGNVVIWLSTFTEDQRRCGLKPGLELLEVVMRTIESRLFSSQPQTTNPAAATGAPRPPTATMIPTSTCSSTPIPGGGTITFDSNRDGDSDIYVMDGSECNLVNLTNNSSTDEGLADWSPDGTRLTFVSGGSLYKMNADGSNRTLLYQSPNPATSNASYPAWSPDGTKIAFQIDLNNRGQEIFLINSDGTGLVQLTSNRGQDNSEPQWLPDGSKIVFGGRHASAWGIYLMNPDGSGQYAISNGQDGCPAVSPDGAKIAFKSHGGGYPGNVEIYTMNIDGSNRTQLTINNSDILDTYPSWSPDGTRIVFMSTRDGSPQLYVMNADGSNQTRITNDTVGDGRPVWR